MNFSSYDSLLIQAKFCNSLDLSNLRSWITAWLGGVLGFDLLDHRLLLLLNVAVNGLRFNPPVRTGASKCGVIDWE